MSVFDTLIPHIQTTAEKVGIYSERILGRLECIEAAIIESAYEPDESELSFRANAVALSGNAQSVDFNIFPGLGEFLILDYLAFTEIAAGVASQLVIGGRPVLSLTGAVGELKNIPNTVVMAGETVSIVPSAAPAANQNWTLVGIRKQIHVTKHKFVQGLPRDRRITNTGTHDDRDSYVGTQVYTPGD